MLAAKNWSEVTLPESLEVLGSCAFGETGITQLHIPASLKYFGIAPIGVKREYGFWVYNTEQTCALYFTGDMPQWEDLSNAMPNLTSTYCYYPRENPTWTENLRDLLDGSGTYQIHWLATDCHPAGVRGADRWFWEAAHGPGAARRRPQPGSHLDQQR